NVGAETKDSTADDQRFMALALALGRRGLGNTWPNPAVGAVIVKEGIIVGRGWTQSGGHPHAETEALRRARKKVGGATMYVTLEPCSHHGKTPPCADAIAKAGIARVVSALEDPNPEVAGAGHKRLAEAGIKVEVGLGVAEARQLHAGHIARMRDGRPHVTLKLAVSADGKAGAAGRKRVAITGEAARARVALMRAENDAILVGIGTVLADDPHLTCRLPGMLGRSPVRIILDTGLRAPMASYVIATMRESPTWVFTGKSASPVAEEILQEKGAKVFRVASHDGRLDLSDVLQALAGEGITRLMVEGGPTVAASFVAAGLVDEAMLFVSPKEIGADGIDALEGMPLKILTGSTRLQLLTSEQIGDDTLEHFGRA
ncbi:MAG TPA: bifunctional diaminohydroxyphosphoribosylaminopyrimidine deaminase/5-amino-6-(5-phosphoribosylamino)uracil reductase RibD, partial [Pseudolabrys sp.]|nr:bifunctional diaminohydroxyphosphoribosylaminopyrimidine deaminase/5-amino-6-(5-phosphoribosylamino)uracil reductase RibD [Pseudolabrys sp.]